MDDKPSIESPVNVRDMLQSLTQGRRYAFLIMSYKSERRPMFRLVAKTLEKDFNLFCVRADAVPGSGLNLLAKIQVIIAGAEIVLADISEPSPNVYYEIGYADKAGKPPLLLIERGREVPTDLRGLEVVEYTNRLGTEAEFRRALVSHLRLRLDKAIVLLQQLLEGPVRFPAFIVASPKYPNPEKIGDHAGQEYDQRTFGDNLGIRGLFTAFGHIFGRKEQAELLWAQFAAPSTAKEDANLYLIGSRKVNYVVRDLEARILGPTAPWRFGHREGKDRSEEGNWPVGLFRRKGEHEAIVEGTKVEAHITTQDGEKHTTVWGTDYGLLVRTPHPQYSGTRVIIWIAGPHSLGTGAACIAATSPEKIEGMRAVLPPGTMEDKASRFWVLVQGTRGAVGGCLDEADVSVLEGGLLDNA